MPTNDDDDPGYDVNDNRNPIYKKILEKRLREPTDTRAAFSKLMSDKRQLEAKRASVNQAIELLDMKPMEGDYADNALRMHAFLMTQVKAIAQSKNVKGEEAQRLQASMRGVWPRLNVGRVFAVPEIAYLSVRAWADRHTTEVVAKVPWRGWNTTGFPSPDIPDDEIETWTRAMREAAAAQPIPEHLPFDTTLLVYGAGAPLSEGDALALVGPEAEKYDQLRLLADLVCSDGVVWQFCLGIDDEGNIGFFGQMLRDKNGEGGWQSGLSLTPWILPGVIDLINSFKKLVHETPRSLGFRKKWEKYQKQAIKLGRGLLHSIPPPFYRVELHQELVEDRVREREKEMAHKHRTWQLQHRCDVRAHERIRVARGKLPIDPEIEQDLLERKYKLFTHNALDLDTARLLMERHERPKSHDEWLAIKVSWIKSHQRGPEDAPYVPALRVLPGPP